MVQVMVQYTFEFTNLLLLVLLSRQQPVRTALAMSSDIYVHMYTCPCYVRVYNLQSNICHIHNIACTV